jgi:glycosyltransferase involved in cell wall biosynthesis
MSDGPYLSLVIPAYNEQENIPTLLGCVDAALAGLGRPFEVVIVDDGSVDSTPALLAEGRKKYPHAAQQRAERGVRGGVCGGAGAVDRDDRC